MLTRPLGRTGVQVSRFGLGTMVLGVWGNRDRAECARIINGAVDAGINLVDTADMYGQGENEEIVGDVLRQRHFDGVARLAAGSRCHIANNSFSFSRTTRSTSATQ